MFARSLILALSLAGATAYTKGFREDAIKWITEEKARRHLAAFDKMTPKMLKTVMTNYLNLVSPDAWSSTPSIWRSSGRRRRRQQLRDLPQLPRRRAPRR